MTTRLILVLAVMAGVLSPQSILILKKKAGGGGSAPAHVQNKNNTITFSGTTISITFDADVTAGNWIAVHSAWSSLTETASLAKSGGTATIDTVSALHNPTAGGVGWSGGMWYVKVTGTGTLTLTATYSGSVSARTLIAHEISGAAATSPVDASAMQAQTDPGTGTDAVSSGADTTTAANCYIFGATVNVNSATPAASGTGYTGRISTGRLTSEDKALASAGSVAATFTAANASHDFITGMIAFKP